MSRFFNGGTAADSISFSLGAGPTSDHPVTIAILAHASSATAWTAWLVEGVNGGSGSWAILTSGNVMFAENDFGSGGPALSTGWCWYVVGKSASTAVPRWHVLDLTAGTGWAHADNSGSVTSTGVTATGINVGSSTSGNALQTWRGRIAAVATWNSVLSDSAVQAACTVSANDLALAAPSWGVLLNQASTATAVTDFTGGGGNQSAISGTSVDADEPPGWSYTISGPRPPAVRVLSQAVNRAGNY